MGMLTPGRKHVAKASLTSGWYLSSISLPYFCDAPVFTQALQEKMDGLDDRFSSCLQKGKGMYMSWLLSYVQDWTRIPMVVWMNRALAPFLSSYNIFHGCMESTNKSWFARHIPCHMYTRTCHTSEENHYFGYPASIPNFAVFPFHQITLPTQVSTKTWRSCNH